MNNREVDRTYIKGLESSEEVLTIDYEARRNDLSAVATGESVLLVEPLESMLWYVPGSKLFAGEIGAHATLSAAERLEGFFKDFASEQLCDIQGILPEELSQRLIGHIAVEQSHV